MSGKKKDTTVINKIPPKSSKAVLNFDNTNTPIHSVPNSNNTSVIEKVESSFAKSKKITAKKSSIN